jgi:hypothetical protein
MAAAAAQKVTRYTTVPQTLYRVQTKLAVSLRDFDVQTAKGRTSYDLKVHSGLVQPAVGPFFTGLRPIVCVTIWLVGFVLPALRRELCALSKYVP